MYHPFDLVSTLIALVRFGDERLLDQLHVAANDSASPDVNLGGTIVWDGGGVDLVTAIERVVPEGMSDFPCRQATGAPLFQIDLMRELHLRYALFERWKGQDPSTFAPDGTRARLDDDNFVPISRFVREHRRAIQDVAKAIDNVTY